MVIIYFSGTGNTKYIAKSFSKIMNCKNYSIEEDMDFEKILSENERIVLCYPIHFSMAPIYFRNFVKKYKTNFRNKKLIIFCTQQFYSGDGARSITDLLEDVEVIYAEHFNMQNNITSFQAYYKLTKINNKKCLEKTYKKLEKISKEINNNEIYLKGFNNFSKKLGKMQHISDEKLKIKQQEAVRVKNNCSLCNKCIKNCPTKNLINNGEKICSNVDCTFCLRCVNICPKKAITVLIHGKVGEQYILD